MKQQKMGTVGKKTLRLFIIIVFITVSVPAIFLAYYHYNNRLFLIEAEILWGTAPFSETEFRKGSSAARSLMVVDLIRSRKYIGEECSVIPDVLGEETGDYYHSDSNSTYKLSERRSSNWILTFICGESGRIERVIIRKSCCSASQKFLHWGLGVIEPLIKHSK